MIPFSCHSSILRGMKLALYRFARNTVVGVSTFLLDIALLYVAVSVLGISYLIATPLAYLIGSTCGYVLSRWYVFKGSERSHHAGYVFFVGVGLAGAAATTALVATLVSAFAMNYLIARTLVAGFVGIVNYLFNLHINFNVAGKHH